MEEENKVETLDDTPTTPVVESLEPVSEAPAPVEPVTEASTVPVVIETPTEPAPVEAPVTTATAETPTEPATTEAPTEVASEAAPTTEPAASTPVEKVEPKKKGKGGILLVLLIVVIAIFAVWFFVLGGNEMLGLKKVEETPNQEEKEDDKKDEEKPSEPVEKKLTEAEVSSYLENIHTIVNDLSIGKKIPFTVTSITNQDLLYFVITHNNGELTKESIDKRMVELFGKDFSYQLEDVNCSAGDGVIYDYDEEAGTFNRVGVHGHGGNGTILEKEFFIDATEKGDTLEIQTKILYAGSCDDLCHPPFDYYANVSMSESIYKINDSNAESYDAMYPQLQDQLPITTFVYKKQSDGNFGLVEVRVEQ